MADTNHPHSSNHQRGVAKVKSCNTALAPRDRRGRSVPPCLHLAASAHSIECADDANTLRFTSCHGRSQSVPPPCVPMFPPVAKSIASLSSDNNIIDVDGNDNIANDDVTFLSTIKENIKNEFSLYSVMVNALSANFSTKNLATLPLSSIFSMVQSLVKNRTKILKEARNTATIAVFNGDADSTLYNDVDETIPSVVPNKRSSKHSLGKILVDCWFVVKKITTLNGYKYTRSFDLREFIGNMEEIEDFCQNAVDEKREKVQVLKSTKLTLEEKARGYLKDGGTKPGFAFPFCIRCLHNLIDLPPSNAIIKAENIAAHQQYMAKSPHLQEYKDGIRPDPPKDKNGKEIKKVSPPAFKQVQVTCKCYKNKGLNCVYKCKFDGKQYPVGSCPVCRCICSHSTTFRDYTAAMYFREIKNLGFNNKSTAEEAKEFVDCGVLANHLTASAAAAAYKSQLDKNRISGSNGVAAAVFEHGSLAQARTLVQKPPSFQVKQQYRSQMEKIHNTAGKTLIEVDGDIQDVRTFGKGGAAGDWKRNNKLSNGDVVVMSQFGNLKNDQEFITPINNHKEIDKETMEAMVALPDRFEFLGKRIRKKIWKNRNDVTPGTEAAHHGLISDMAIKKRSAALQVMEDAANGDESDYENSQELLDYMTQLKKKDLNMK